MAVKKKAVKKEEEERRPPVTQVVEVVEEDDGETIQTAVAEPTPTSEMLEEMPAKEETKEEEVVGTTNVSEDEKRRVLVDELFEKKPPRPYPVVPEISVHRKPRMRPIILWAITLIIASLVVGGIIMIASGKSGSFPSIMATPTPTPTNSPSPTPTPDLSNLDRSTLAVQVLNGSGVAGTAGKMKDLLEEKGYTVENTGNADNYDYETTEILVKAGSVAYLVLLEEDLQESYSLGTSTATLADDVPYDVRIVVGKE